MFFGWVSDIEIIDNRMRQFSYLQSDWMASKIKLSDGQEVIPTIENLITLATYCLNEASVNKKEAFSYSGFDAYFQNNVLELNYSLSRVNTLEVIFG
jgi:hypothetical protein